MTDDTNYIYVGGQQENVQFNGLTPGLADLFQVNATVISGTPAGTDFSDISTPDAYTSEVTLAVGSGSGGMARVQPRLGRTSGRRPGRPGRGRGSAR